jgi:hypothetical protein
MQIELVDVGIFCLAQSKYEIIDLIKNVFSRFSVSQHSRFHYVLTEFSLNTFPLYTNVVISMSNMRSREKNKMTDKLIIDNNLHH